MEPRWSFTFFKSFHDAAMAIGDKEVRADFYTAVCEYAINGVIPEDISDMAKAMFLLAKPNLDVSKKKAEAGARGGRASGKQTEANGKQTASDKRIENREKRIENGDIDLTISDEIVCRTRDVQRVVDAWNDLGLQSIRKILPDTDRGKMLKKRIQDYGLDAVLEAIKKVKESPFLLGNNDKGWAITFDWFIKPNNFPKVLGGNYSNRTATNTATQPNKYCNPEQPTKEDYQALLKMRDELINNT